MSGSQRGHSVMASVYVSIAAPYLPLWYSALPRALSSSTSGEGRDMAQNPSRATDDARPPPRPPGMNGKEDEDVRADEACRLLRRFEKDDSARRACVDFVPASIRSHIDEQPGDV